MNRSPSAAALPHIETDEAAIDRFWNAEPPQLASPATIAAAMADLIGKAADSLLARRDDLVALLARAHAFSRTESARAVEMALSPLRARDLLAQWEGEGLAGLRSDSFPRRTLVIGGGAIPQPTVLAMAAALMASAKVLYRPSRLDPVLAPLLADEMARLQDAATEEAPFHTSRIGGLSDRLLCARWPRDRIDLTGRLIRRSDAVVAFGDAATMQTLRELAPPSAQLFLYGPGISFAALDLTGGRDAENRKRILAAAAPAIAEDVAAYDQRGCLSPAALYLVGATHEDRDAATALLAAALEERARRHGYTPQLPASAAVSIQSLRLAYAMDPAEPARGARAIRTGGTLPSFTLLAEPLDPAAALLRPMPGYQTLRIVPVPDWPALLRAVEPLAGRLQAMGLGPDAKSCPPEALERLEQWGLSRVCPLGRMQAPPLNWTHDGNPFFPVRRSAD